MVGSFGRSGVPGRDIEPTDGEWHWQQPDFAVRAADYYDLGLIVLLDHPPDWALAPTEGSAIAPIDLEAYADFVGTVAQRYRGKVQAYIIWNEPNLSREWANRPPDATAYTALLCRAYAVLTATDPGATIVSAGLAPSNGGGGEAMDDRLFLREMYEAGARTCFDALGAHAYGFGHRPEDPRGSHAGLNLTRLADLREIMIEHGARAVPVWITELGWTTDGTGAHEGQTVSTEQQAEYLTRAWRYIGREWPWVRMVTVWNLSQGLPASDEMAGYSLLQGDGTPKPAYRALSDLLQKDQNEDSDDSGEHQSAIGAAEAEVLILRQRMRWCIWRQP
jgi:GH35 family endo-1,4-beta-xylanase